MRLEELSDLVGQDDGLLREEDVFWTLDRVLHDDEARRPAWARVAYLLARHSKSADVWDQIMTMAGTQPQIAAEFEWFLGSVSLDSPRIIEERERRARRMRAQQERARNALRAGVLIEKALAEDEAGQGLQWPRVFDALAVNPQGCREDVRFETAPTSLPGWINGDESRRLRTVTAAKRYLLEARLPDDDWLGTQTVPGVAVAGYGALRLVLDLDAAWLEEEGVAFWTRWAAALLGYPAWREPGHKRLVALLYQHAADAVLALVPRLAAESSLLDELDAVWGGSPRLSLPSCSGRCHGRIYCSPWPSDSCAMETLIRGAI